MLRKQARRGAERKALRFAILVGVFILLAGVAGWAWEVKKRFRGKIVDVHSHVYRGEEDFEDLLAAMDRNDIALMGLSGLTWSDPDDQVRQAERAFPGKFLPFLRGFDPTWDHAPDYVKNRLAGGEYNGIGELFINGHGRRLEGDHPVLMKIYALAAAHDVPVLLHWTIGSHSERERGDPSTVARLKNVLRSNPKTKFILAHCGKGPPPLRPDYETIADDLLFEFPHLTFDLSNLHSDIFTVYGELSNFGFDLQNMVKKHPSQFVVGFDLGEPGMLYAQADQGVQAIRHFLAKLPPKIIVKVARGNALALLQPGMKRNETIRAARKRAFKKPPEHYSEFLYSF